MSQASGKVITGPRSLETRSLSLSMPCGELLKFKTQSYFLRRVLYVEPQVGLATLGRLGSLVDDE